MESLTIDGKRVAVRAGATLLEATRAAGAAVPTLCHHPALEAWGGCRLCMVDITRASWDGYARMVAACMYPAEDGLIVTTASERVVETRRVVLDLLLARCPDTPLVRELAAAHGLSETTYRKSATPTDCVLCGLCTRACDQVGRSAISSVDRGAGREIAPPFRQAPPDCVGCLACAEVCPTGFIKYQTSDRERTIWGQRFDMQRCSRCGRGHVTRDQAAHFSARSGVPRSYFELCDACKRRETATTSARLQVIS
jgi:NADH dehydrogenase/NADH:ubiquinone oxidoreductase subunit G